MLNLAYSRQFQSRDFQLAPDVQGLSEGIAMVMDYTTPVPTVRPALGKSDEVFIGVSICRVSHDNIMSTSKIVEVIQENSGYYIIAPTDVIATSITGYQPDDAYLDNSHFTVDSRDPRKFKVNLDMSTTGTRIDTITIVYQFNPTVVQARGLQGDQWPGAPLTSTIGHVGVIIRGEVFTSSYDTACDWTNPTALYITKNGVFTTTSTGNTKVNCVVTQLPTTGNGFLGLTL